MHNAKLALTPDALRSYDRWHLIIGFILLLLLFAMPPLFGIGPGSCSPCAASPARTSAPAAATVAPAPVAMTATEPAAPAEAVPAATPSVARLFFAVGSATPPAEATQALAPIIEHLKARPSSVVVLSGYHDASGSRARNEALTLDRARAVRAMLEAAGIATERIDMAKPQETVGSGSAREARRVEVSLHG